MQHYAQPGGDLPAKAYAGRRLPDATAALTILLAPTLMLDLISLAYFFVIQLLHALLGILFVRCFSALGLTAGLIGGNAAVILLYFLRVDVAGINLGLVVLVVNFLVTFVVSAATKDPSPTPPIAATAQRAEGSAA